jgi:hypothetical protein
LQAFPLSPPSVSTAKPQAGQWVMDKDFHKILPRPFKYHILKRLQPFPCVLLIIALICYLQNYTLLSNPDNPVIFSGDR